MGIGVIGVAEAADASAPSGVGAKIRDVSVGGYNSLGTLSAGTYWIQSDKDLDLFSGASGYILRQNIKKGLNKVDISSYEAGEIFAAQTDLSDCTWIGFGVPGSSPVERTMPINGTCLRTYIASDSSISLHVEPTSYALLYDSTDKSSTFITESDTGANTGNNRVGYALGWSADGATNYIYTTDKDNGNLRVSSDKGANWSTLSVSGTASYTYAYVTSVAGARDGRFFALLCTPSNDQYFLLRWGRGTTIEGQVEINLSSATSNQYANGYYNTVVTDPESDGVFVFAYTGTAYQYAYWYVNATDANLAALSGVQSQQSTVYFNRESNAVGEAIFRTPFNLWAGWSNRQSPALEFVVFGLDSANTLEFDSQSYYPEYSQLGWSNFFYDGTYNSYVMGIIGIRDRFTAYGRINRKFDANNGNVTFYLTSQGIHDNSSSTSPSIRGLGGSQREGLPSNWLASGGSGALTADGDYYMSTSGTYFKTRRSIVTIYGEAA